VVEDPARRSDNDLGAAFQRPELPFDWLAAVDREDADPIVAGCQPGELFCDLDGEFAGGGEDQNLGLPAPGVDALDRGDAKRRCLAGACLGLAGDVAAFEQCRDGADLDGGRLFKPHLFDGAEGFWRDIEVLESDILIHSRDIGLLISLYVASPHISSDPAGIKRIPATVW